MQHGLNVHYRSAAEHFARNVVLSLGTQVHSVVLYGSVARKRARHTSVTDVLVIGADVRGEERAFDLAYELIENSGFETFITPLYFARADFERLVLMRTSFVSSILEEGSILYDDGTFAEARKRVLSSC